MNKKEFVTKLEKDNEILINEKLSKVLAEENYGTYKNLVSVIRGNMEIIKELENAKQSQEELLKLTADMLKQETEDKLKSMWDAYFKSKPVYQVTIGNKDVPNNTLNFKTKKKICDHIKQKIDCELLALPEYVKLEKLDCEEQDKYSIFEDMLLRFIERETYGKDKIQVIIPTTELIRGIGKTTFLVKQAINSGGTYVGSNYIACRNATYIAKEELEGQYVCALTLDDLKSGVKYNYPLYIDEGVDLSKFDLINNEYLAFQLVK